jgi:hypothetical protein
MAIIQSYPTGTPKDGDYLIGTSMPAVNSDELPVTKNFPIADVLGLSSDSYIKFQKVVVSTAELRTLNSPVKILINNPGSNKNILQVYGIVSEITGNTATNKLVFPNNLEITNKSVIGVTPFKYVIPQAIANDTTSAYFIPSLVAGETSFGAELILQSAAAPTETGTAATTMTFWITYRIFNIQD